MTSLPHESGTARGDLRSGEPIILSGNTNAGGSATLKTQAVPFGQRWQINYVTITNDGAATAALSMYVDEALPRNLLDGTEDASSAVAPYAPPRIIDQGQLLVFVFSNATPQSACTVRIEYDVAVL